MTKSSTTDKTELTFPSIHLSQRIPWNRNVNLKLLKHKGFNEKIIELSTKVVELHWTNCEQVTTGFLAIVPLLETTSKNRVPFVTSAVVCLSERWQTCPRTASLDHQGRRGQKRYGVLLNYQLSRFIHQDSANTLTTNSFIKAFRRFLSRARPASWQVSRGNLRPKTSSSSCLKIFFNGETVWVKSLCKPRQQHNRRNQAHLTRCHEVFNKTLLFWERREWRERKGYKAPKSLHEKNQFPFSTRLSCELGER